MRLRLSQLPMVDAINSFMVGAVAHSAPCPFPRAEAKPYDDAVNPAEHLGTQLERDSLLEIFENCSPSIHQRTGKTPYSAPSPFDWIELRNSAALWACAAALKMKRLSPFSTSSQEAR